MVKAYLKYEENANFSAVCTNKLRKLHTVQFDNTACFVAAANELVYLVTCKTGEIQLSIQHPSMLKEIEVSEVERLEEQSTLLIGYSNGDVVLFNYKLKEHRLFDKHDKRIDRLFFVKENLQNFVVSCSNDKRVLVWDFESLEEFFELKEHSAPVTDLTNNKDFLTTLTSDGIIRQFSMKDGVLQRVVMTNKNELNFIENVKLETNDGDKDFSIVISVDELLFFGISDKLIDKTYKAFRRESFTKINQIEIKGSFVFLLSTEGVLEIYKLMNKAEAIKKYKRKAKRGVKDLESQEAFLNNPINFITKLKELTLDKGIKHFFILKSKTENLLYTTAFDNKISVFKLTNWEIEGKVREMVFGHVNPINYAIMSQDDNYLVTSSAENVIIWNPQSSLKIKQINIKNVGSMEFLPGNQLLVLASKKGDLQLINCAKAETVCAIELKDEKGKGISISSIKLLEVKKDIICIGIVCSDLSFRKYKLIASEGGRFGLEEFYRLPLPDEPLKIDYLPQNNKILISYLDNSLKSYFNELNKIKEDVLFYGHSLQVTDFGFTNDEYILASVSRDKSLRIWDIKFGNCRRIINKIHEGGASCISMIKDTHYVLTGGRENVVKYWDLDTFDLIMVLEGVMGNEIRQIVTSRIGDVVFSFGKNKTIRKYIQTKEQVFPSDHQDDTEEKELYLAGLNSKTNEDEDLGVINKKIENLKTAENYMDMIDRVEKDHNEDYVRFEDDILLGKKRQSLVFKELNNKNPAEYVLERLSKIPRHRLDSVFTFFHFNTYKILLKYVRYALENYLYIDLCKYILKIVFERQSQNVFRTEETSKVVKQCVDLLKDICVGRLERENYINEGLGILTKEMSFFN